MVGRKFTFLVTITVMGVSTALVGILPTYAQIGILAPILLVTLRLAQGLALGGEYGGAAIYVAEHSHRTRNAVGKPRGSRRRRPSACCSRSWSSSSPALSMSPEDFAAWGWRIPFLLSAILVVHRPVHPAPPAGDAAVQRLKAQGKSSTSPWRESFGDPRNAKLILLALFGATAGQAVVWYQGQFQALFFLGTNLGVRFTDAYLIMGTAIVLATPFFLVFGRLSDRIGRKRMILAGCALAAITYVPIYNLMIQFAHPQGTFDPRKGRYVDAAGKPAIAQPDILPLIALVFDPDPLRDDGLRPDRRVPRRVLPGAHPVHQPVDPVPHRERLVRRVPAAHLGRDHRGHRQPHRGADLPDHGRDHHDRSSAGCSSGRAAR